MNLNRRRMLQGLTAGFGAALSGGFMPSEAFGSTSKPSSMKRNHFLSSKSGF
jgi:hypothetical protein